MNEEVIWVTCPYCGERTELEVDPAGGQNQRYTSDCPVCCRPWEVLLEWGGDTPCVTVRTDSE